MPKESNAVLGLIGGIILVIFAVMFWPNILNKILSNAENKQMARIFGNFVMVVFVIVLISIMVKFSKSGV